MYQAVLKLERSIKERRLTDIVFINYWIYVLFINPITIFISSFVLFIKKIERVNQFIDRKRKYHNAVIDYTEKRAKKEGKYNVVLYDLLSLQQEINQVYIYKFKTMKAWLSLILTILTLGIYGLIVLYKLNKFWDEIQEFEDEFHKKISIMWLKLKVTKFPIRFMTNQKKRNYPLYVFLSFITLGIWAIYWDYQIHTDPDRLYEEFHHVEDTMMQTIRYQ